MENQHQEVETSWQEREAERLAKLESRKKEIIADEGRFQRVCGAYVGRNVIYCASSLMYGIGKLMWERNFREAFEEDGDSLMPLFERLDYETPVDSFIDDADLDDLEKIADMVGYWDDIQSAVGYEIYCDTQREMDCDPVDFAEWVESQDDSCLDAIRQAVKDLITNADEYREIADEFNIEPDRDEVYEHWIVDRYFAEELEEHGQVVGEFAGLTIWGRCTTGQSISMDGIIREIVREKCADHWIWGES